MIAAPWSIAWPVDARVRPSPLSPAGPDAPRAVTPCFTLLVVASADGLIGRHPGHSPADWASAEEQALFLSAVDAADWSVMGRGTHETAFRPQRRRIVFSRSAPAPQWRAPAHLWLDPARLTLEITEQALLGDLDLAARSLGLLRDAGMRIALDDFGAGFCNFGYLKYLPLDCIKLDGVAENPRDRAVLRAVVAMAQALGLEILAEGVENEAQRRIAAEEGCTAYQGFLRAKPLTQEDFLQMAGDFA